ESPVEDTLLVQLNPLYHADVPRSAGEIADRVNTLTFNQPLLRDVQVIVAAKEEGLGWFSGRNSRTARLRRHRFHLIEAGAYTAGLSADTKLRPDKGLLTYLHGAGRTEARKWLNHHRAAIGRHSTVDLRARFLEANGRAHEEPAAKRK